jgi:hypothetical protein
MQAQPETENLPRRAVIGSGLEAKPAGVRTLAAPSSITESLRASNAITRTRRFALCQACVNHAPAERCATGQTRVSLPNSRRRNSFQHGCLLSTYSAPNSGRIPPIEALVAPGVRIHTSQRIDFKVAEQSRRTTAGLPTPSHYFVASSRSARSDIISAT